MNTVLHHLAALSREAFGSLQLFGKRNNAPKIQQIAVDQRSVHTLNMHNKQRTIGGIEPPFDSPFPFFALMAVVRTYQPPSRSRTKVGIFNVAAASNSKFLIRDTKRSKERRKRRIHSAQHKIPKDCTKCIARK